MEYLCTGLRTSRLNFYKVLFTETQKTKNLIMAGDFNIILKEEDTNGKFDMKRYMTFVKNRIDRQSFEDAHITLNKGQIKYTFTASGKKIRKRLDKYLYTKHLRNRLIDYYIKPNSFSDHDSIILQIDIGERKKWGKGLWKMNNEVIKEERYRRYMTEVINNKQEKKVTENLKPESDGIL